MLVETPSTDAARKDEAPVLADLIVIAGDGLPLVHWDDLRQGAETALEVGRSRAARDTGGFSYRNADVVRRDGQVISAIVSYPVTDLTPKAGLLKARPLFQPLIALENLAVPSWYINALATLPDARGSGAATALLRTAAAKARKAGFGRLSLITGDINPARRLYERLGFRCTAHRPIFKDGWRYGGTRWLLYIKDLPAVQPKPRTAPRWS